MITGAHFLLYSTDAAADRAFIRDVLGFRSVDLGEGWLIFGLPPAEMAVHPGGDGFTQDHGGAAMAGTVLYLMCDDLDAETARLASAGVRCGAVAEADWGRSTSIPLPGGGHLGLYQPAHPTALAL